MLDRERCGYGDDDGDGCTMTQVMERVMVVPWDIYISRIRAQLGAMSRVDNKSLRVRRDLELPACRPKPHHQVVRYIPRAATISALPYERVPTERIKRGLQRALVLKPF